MSSSGSNEIPAEMYSDSEWHNLGLNLPVHPSPMPTQELDVNHLFYIAAAHRSKRLIGVPVGEQHPIDPHSTKDANNFFHLLVKGTVFQLLGRTNAFRLWYKYRLKKLGVAKGEDGQVDDFPEVGPTGDFNDDDTLYYSS